MITLVRASASGLRRYCSPYLLSAFLMLLGAFLTARHDGAPGSADLRFLFYTQIAYQTLLWMILVYLMRAKRLIEDSVMLLGILGIFVLDAAFLQPLLYGWSTVVGFSWGMIAFVSSALLWAMTLWAFRISLFSRLMFAVVICIAFIRLAPVLLSLAGPGHEGALMYTGLGWLACLCLLPLFVLPRTVSGYRALNIKALETIGILICLGATGGHLAVAGSGFDLSFQPAILGPLVVLLAPAVDQILSKAGRKRFLVLGHLFPLAGAGLALAGQPLILRTAEAASQTVLITPFRIVLLLAVAVYYHRARSCSSPCLLYMAAFLGSLALMGHDGPSVLANLFQPAAWQIAGVTLWIWLTIGLRPIWGAGLILHIIPAIWTGFAIAVVGVPWEIAASVLYLWGIVFVALFKRRELPRTALFILAFLLIGLPVAGFALDMTSAPRAALAGIQCFSVMLLGWRWRHRFAFTLALCAGVFSAAVFSVSWQLTIGVNPGHLCVGLAFAALLLGFLKSLYGSLGWRWVRAFWKSLGPPVREHTT
ncbi:hypothetical protein ACFLU6_08670 [Acidobacteriota bacterium]